MTVFLKVVATSLKNPQLMLIYQNKWTPASFQIEEDKYRQVKEYSFFTTAGDKFVKSRCFDMICNWKKKASQRSTQITWWKGSNLTVLVLIYESKKILSLFLIVTGQVQNKNNKKLVGCPQTDILVCIDAIGFENLLVVS